MKIGIFSDHGGFDLIEEIVSVFESLYKDHELIDFGTFSKNPVDYPDYSLKAAIALKNKDIGRAILLCGTGIGICIGANRFPWVRAFVAHKDYEVTLARNHNDANAICFSGRYQTLDDVLPLINIFLKTPFEGGRHETRIDKLNSLTGAL